MKLNIKKMENQKFVFIEIDLEDRQNLNKVINFIENLEEVIEQFEYPLSENELKVFRQLVGIKTKAELQHRVTTHFAENTFDPEDSYQRILLQCMEMYKSFPKYIWKNLKDSGVPSEFLTSMEDQ